MIIHVGPDIGCFVAGTKVIVPATAFVQTAQAVVGSLSVAPIVVSTVEQAWNSQLLLAGAGAFVVAGSGVYAARRRKRRKQGVAAEQGVDAVFRNLAFEDLLRDWRTTLASGGRLVLLWNERQ